MVNSMKAPLRMTECTAMVYFLLKEDFLKVVSGIVECLSFQILLLNPIDGSSFVKRHHYFI